jgi:hypothetical protein
MRNCQLKLNYDVSLCLDVTIGLMSQKELKSGKDYDLCDSIDKTDIHYSQTNALTRISQG